MGFSRIAVVVLALGPVACSAGPVASEEPIPENCAEFIDVEKDIFQDRCATEFCHGAVERPAAELDLVSEGVAERIIGAPSWCAGDPLIEPGDPTGGVFIEKLDDPPCGLRMPVGERPLSAAEVHCVREWIVTAAAQHET